MDFRTCPACQASVLEDDAVDCPFCGESMTTGKPRPKGAKSPPAAKTTAASTPTAAPSGRSATDASSKAKSARTASKSTGDDTADPFEVDTSSARKAFPVRPRPAKGYMIRITCPMCERPGFISPKEAGKEVKCCNPDCLVPVFIAQPPPEKEPEPVPVETGNRLWLWGGMGIVAIAVGVAAMFVINRKPPQGTGPIEIGPITSQGREPVQDPVTNTGPQRPAAELPPLTAAEINQKALEGLRAAMQAAQNPRERALATRFLAESFIETDQTAKARAELASLASSVKHLAILPLSLEAWKQIDAGELDTARGTLDSAVELQSKLPKQGRDALDAVAPFAAALVAVGRDAEAKALAAAHNDPQLGQISALWRAAIDGGAFRFGHLSHRSSLRDLPHPQWASVTQTLASHRKFDEAQAWALAAPDRVARESCCAVLAAEMASRLGPGADLERRLASMSEALEPTGKARIWCAVGQALLERNDQAAATTYANRAAETLQSLPAPQAIPVPEMADLYELATQPRQGLPDPAPATSAAFAAIDLFELQTQLAADPLPALKLLMQSTQGIGPGVPATTALIREIDENPAATRRRFAESQMIDENTAFARFSRYQTQVKNWHEQALARQTLEVRLLTRAALAGQEKEVWSLMQSAQSASGPEQQTYKNTTLPGLVLELANAKSREELRQQIAAEYPKAPPQASQTDRVLVTLQRDPEFKDWQRHRQMLKTYFERREADHHRVDIVLLNQVLARLEADPQAALDLATELPDPLVSEDALWLVAARGTVDGQARKLLDGFVARKFPSTTALALYRGFIDGANAPGGIPSK